MVIATHEGPHDAFDAAISLGSRSTALATDAHGVLFDEPTVAAIDPESGGVLAVGVAALELEHRAPLGVELIWPLKGEALGDSPTDHAVVEQIVRRAAMRLGPSARFARTVTVLPHTWSGVHQRRVQEIVEHATRCLRPAYLIERDAAAGQVVVSFSASMLVDVGDGSNAAASILTRLGIAERVAVDVSHSDPPDEMVEAIRRIVIEFLHQDLGAATPNDIAIVGDETLVSAAFDALIRVTDRRVWVPAAPRYVALQGALDVLRRSRGENR